MSVIFIIIISFLISFAWLYYFKLIDLFEQEKIFHLVVTFVLGTIIPFSIYFIHDYIYYPLGIYETGKPFEDFFFFFLGVGLLEEAIKLIPVIIVFYLIRKAINEPLDYVKYICVSALGFAFGENIEYALNYGGSVLMGRSILSVPGHMFFSAMFIYGWIEYKFHNQKFRIVPLYLVMGALCHGIYDFLWTFKLPVIGILINTCFFFILISVFVTILNNCLNISPFYSPRKIVDQEIVRKRLFLFYVGIIVSILVYAGYYEGIEYAFGAFLLLLIWKSTILLVLIVRLSRFSIVPNLKNRVRIKFPFYYNSNPSKNDIRAFFGFFTIRGEPYNAAKISMLYHEPLKVIPVNAKKSYLNQIYFGIIENKIFENDTLYFLLKIYLDAEKINYQHFVLIPKTEGQMYSMDGHPIAALHGIDKSNGTKLYFHEWVILKKK